MHCPNCGRSLLVNETTCTRCGRVVLLADPPDTPPWEPWRRWVPLLGVIAFAAAATAIVVAVKPFVASGKGDRIVLTLPTLAPLRTTTPVGAPPTTLAGSPPSSATSSPTTAVAAGGTDTTAPTDPSAVATPDSTATTAAADSSAPSSVVTTAAPATSPPSTRPLVPAGPLQITGATATCTAPASTDSKGNPTTFDAGNTIDGRDSTAWRCAGDASGQSLTFTFASPVQITSVGAEPGYNRIDQFNGADRWVENRRVTSITWSCIAPGGAATGTVAQTFQDAKQVQTTATQGGFDKCAALQATITGATPPGIRDFTAISEVSAAGRPAA